MKATFDMVSGTYVEIEENDNQFVHVNHDQYEGSLVITSDYFGTGIPLYFVVENDLLYICDSLKVLKSMTKGKFVLNRSALPIFIRYGFIPGEKTLVSGVKKLPPMKKLVAIRGKGVEVLDDVKMDIDEMGKDLATSLETYYEDTMEKAVKDTMSQLQDGKRCCMALSGGFDSNALLYFAKNKLHVREVHAFSVGGVTGVDETKAAEDITGFYEGVSFSKAMVSPQTLRYLDDIVYRLEGCVYERGIFLQYELAKLVHEQGWKEMMLGECANEVFNGKAYTPTPDHEAFVLPNDYRYLEHPYQMASYIVLTKNMLMLRSFGIKGWYPYLHKEVIGMASRNGVTKDFHNIQCVRLLPAGVGERLKKQGGTTSLLSLFNGGFDMDRALEKCKYYNRKFKLTRRYEPEEAKADYFLTLKYVESFERQFCSGNSLVGRIKGFMSNLLYGARM